MKTPLGSPGVATNGKRGWRRSEPDGAARTGGAADALHPEPLSASSLGEWRLEVWVRRYTSMVYSLMVRMTGDGGWAEELTQDVFLELDRNQARMQSEEHIRRWLRQVAMHRAVDAMRRRNSREPGWREGRWMGLEEAGWAESGLAAVPTEASKDAGRGAGWDAGLSVRVSARVERWLMALPERQRETVLLRYQEAMTPEEIAATLGAPLATIKSQLQRGLKALRGLAERERNDAK